MKKYIHQIALVAMFVVAIPIIIVMYFIGSCKFSENSKERAMAERAVEMLSDPDSFKKVSFGKVVEKTFEDNIKDSLVNLYAIYEVEENIYQTDSVTMDYYKSVKSDDYVMASISRSVLRDKQNCENTLSKIIYFESLLVNNKINLNKVVYKTYKLEFTAKNAFGVATSGVCYGVFDNDGKLVSFKLMDKTRNIRDNKAFSVVKINHIL